jgi:hypothetical protein
MAHCLVTELGLVKSRLGECLGPRRKKWRVLVTPHLGRRIVYGLVDLKAWLNTRMCDSTFDPNHHELR